MSHRNDLLNRINQFSKSLIVKSRWYKTNKPFGHIDYQKDKRSYIYEFFCYLKILKDLKSNYDLEYIEGDHQFPQSHSNKKDKSKFVIKEKITGKKYQVCTGTDINISTIDDYTIAPDISFQKENATDDPTEKDVLLIMDAKYKSNPTKSNLSISLLQQFAEIIVDLNVSAASTQPINFDKYKNLLSNCLLTNGTGLTDKDDFCKKKKMKQVVKFDVTGTYDVIG